MEGSEQSQLLRELQDLISSGNASSSEILKLAQNISKADGSEIRFSVDAGIIDRLGSELVSRQETAVSELVKNAYDADATIVDLIFSNSTIPGGALEIFDNGNGMTRDELLNGFMRISSDSKIKEPISPVFNRRRAGRKGIGRFAVHRLGSRLTIITQTKDSNKALKVIIDWDNFESGQDITDIPARLEEVGKSVEQGTTLLIENLNDSWSDAQIKRIWRYVSDLLQPFPLSGRNQEVSEKIDPGFRADFYKINDGGEAEVIADQDNSIFEFAVADIRAHIDNEGRGYISINSSRIPEVNYDQIPMGPDPDDPSIRFEQLRNISFQAYYFIHGSGFIPRGMTKTIQNILDSQGGIRMYKNGFRVLPYGEKKDDWLDLDKVSARRQILPPFSNINFLGFVEIDDPNEDLFIETSSREGVVENTNFRSLHDFLFRILRFSVLRIASFRGTKLVAEGRESQIESPPEEKFQRAVDELKQATNSLGDVEYEVDSIISEVESAFEEIKDTYKVSQARLIDENGLYRVLASLGIVIAEFTHEIMITLTSAQINASDLQKMIKEPKEAILKVQQLNKNIQKIYSYARYFDKTLQDNSRRELAPIEIGTAVVEFRKELLQNKNNIANVEIKILDFDLYTIPAHISEITSVLFNFYSNSIKALSRSSNSSGEILIKCGRDEGLIYIEFYDNGDGIDPTIQNLIFNPFFTTSFGNYDDIDDEIKGTGLGLKIVKDIADSYGGDVFLKDPGSFSTCFRFEIPAANEQQLSDFNIEI